MSDLTKFEFGGHPLTVIEYSGERFFLASELSLALGYSRPDVLGNLMAREWAAEFQLGTDFNIIRGAELAALKKTRGSLVYARNSLSVLTKSGAQLACIKTNKPIGVQLRRWLVDEVFPALERGELPGAAPARPALPPNPIGPVRALTFDGQVVAVIGYNGEPCLLASHLSKALGYRRGDRLGALLADEWRHEFEEARDFYHLKGQELTALQRATGSLARQRKAATLLTPSGVKIVLLKTTKPGAGRLARWVAAEVFGETVPVLSSVPPVAVHRSELDVVSDFIAARCVFHPRAKATSGALRDAYRDWCRQSGAPVMGDRMFRRQLTKLGYLASRDVMGFRAWGGLGLRHAPATLALAVTTDLAPSAPAPAAAAPAAAARVALPSAPPAPPAPSPWLSLAMERERRLDIQLRRRQGRDLERLTREMADPKNEAVRLLLAEAARLQTGVDVLALLQTN